MHMTDLTIKGKLSAGKTYLTHFVSIENDPFVANYIFNSEMQPVASELGATDQFYINCFCFHGRMSGLHCQQVVSQHLHI